MGLMVTEDVDHATQVVGLSRGLGLLFAFLAGTAIPAQARINSALAARLHDGLVAALISFGTGLLLLALLALALPALRRGLRRIRDAARSGTLRWWHFTGGLCGALLVASQGLTVGVLGVAVFTVAVVGGQIGSSLVMDRLGVAPGGPQRVTAQRLVGALLAVAAVGLAVSDRLAHPAGLALAVLPLLAGIAAAWQQGVNGRVGVAARADETRSLLVSTLPATLLNFATGTAALAAVALVGVLRHGPPAAPPAQLWYYLGGPIGMAFIAAMVVLVRHIGVLLLGLGMVAGQLVASVLLDLLVPTGGHPLTAVAITGTALTLVAAAIAAWPARTRPSGS
jgi:transporter family-2 protein